MILLYVITNYLDGLAIGSFTTKSTSSLYIATNLSIERPSKPYRTTGIGAVADPEYICVDLGSSKPVTFIGIFNHNFTLMEAGDDSLLLKGCDSDCATCTWATPDCGPVDLRTLPTAPCAGCPGTQPIANHKNLWHKIDCGTDHRYWRLEMIDTTNTDGYLEIGELVLGQWQQFPRGVLSGDDSWVRLSPGRADGPEFFMGKNRTFYGQDWSTHYSEYERFDLVLTTQNDPCIVDAIHTFLKAVQLAGGRFILVPDDDKPFCYYVIIDNLRDYAERKIYGRTGELREWRLKLKSLTEGVKLL
jgi:hypothetical protein